MAIKKYTPPTRSIIDNRNPNGGFYEATCDSCGTIYYPKRITSKYCTPKCGLDNFRKNKAEKLALGGEVKTPDDYKKLAIQTKMKIKKAEENYSSFLSSCGKTRGNENYELQEIEKHEKIIEKLQADLVFFQSKKG